MAGGKPYIIFGMAFAAYALLSVTRTDIKVIKWVVLASILIALGDGALGMASQLFPFVAVAVIPIYSGVNFGAAQGAIVVMDEGSRLSAGKNIGQTLGLTACTLYPPGHTMLPFRVVPFLLMSGAVILILLSGFRSTLGWLGMVFIVGCLVRRRYLDILIAGVIGMVGLVFILGSGMSANLPIALQRTLSIIPFADVDDTIRHQAQRSTDWRVEMWVLAMTTDRYISNKWLGDGFNFSAAELQAQQDAMYGDRRRAGTMNMADMMMARGSYHGFHVETIRFTGAFGLLCALIAMGIWFRYALKLLRHFKGRPEWGYVIFICLPFLIHPFYYMLVFGAYRSGFTELLVASGMLKILDNIRVRELAAARVEAKAPKEQPAATAVPRRPHRGFPAPAMRSVGTRGLTRP